MISLKSPRPRSRSATRSWVTAGTVALVMLAGTISAVAQPTTTPLPAPQSSPAELAPAPLPSEPASDQPIAPENDELSSKTADPDPEWTPTEDPNATVVPGDMRSDREEIPAGATKEMADQAETMEARQRMSRAAAGCQTYWPFPYEVCGVIRDKYNSLGGPGSFLSYPNSPEYTNPDGYGKRTQFLNGPIYWSAGTGAHPVVNSFLHRWGVHRYEAGWLGYPTTDEIVHTDGVGRRQEFQRGAIYVAFVNAIGSAIANGPIRDKWNSIGAHTGWLGYLTSDELARGTTKYHEFANGRIVDTAFDEPQALTRIQSVLNNADEDVCSSYSALAAGQCYTNPDFYGALETMEQCLYPELRKPTDKNWSDETIVAVIKAPNETEPELTLSCGRYKHLKKHRANYDPENFLACAGLVYNLGSTDSAPSAPGNEAKSWVNRQSNVRSFVVWEDVRLPKAPLITSYAGPFVDGDETQLGNDWGGCAEGYIVDLPTP